VIVIIGNKDDDAIGAALQWALTQTEVEHRIFYPAATTKQNEPRMHEPSWPKPDNSDWTPYTPKPMPKKVPPAIAPPDMLCCYYEEVIVIAHGSQKGLWPTLLGDVTKSGCLPFVLQGKKVKRFVLWVCGSAAEVYPHHLYIGNYFFEYLAYLIGPPVSCPCGCDPALCNAWNARQTKKNLKCPYAQQCVTLLSAAWYDHHAAKLGLDANDATAPFTSPDGRLLKTTICAIWLPGVIPLPVSITKSAITTLPAAGDAGITVFNGLKVKASPSLKSAGDPPVTPNSHTGPKGRTLGLKPPKYRRAPYVGPAACPTRDGCLH